MCCLSVSLCRGVGRMVRHSSSGEPVGWSACRMVCLWLSVPSVLGVGCAACACGLVAVVCVGRMVCHSSSGEPVGWSACRIGCLWSIPSTYCQPVSLCRGLCRSVGWSATVPAVRVWDVLPMVVNSLGGAGCRCRMVCHSSSGECVRWRACGMCCLWSVPSTPCQR